MNDKTRRKIQLAMAGSMLIIVACLCGDYAVSTVEYNGWVCVEYNPRTQQVYQCTLACDDGTHVGPIYIENTSQLDSETIPTSCIASTSSPAASLPTLTSTETLTPDPLDTPTATITSLPALPLLTNQMTSCGNYGTVEEPAWFINLRLAEPPLDITGKNLQVTIGGLQSSCGINQGNQSILTCFASQDVVYPASVVVKLDDVEVNNFTINPNRAICDAPPTATEEPTEDVPAAETAISTP